MGQNKTGINFQNPLLTVVKYNNYVFQTLINANVFIELNRII